MNGTMAGEVVTARPRLMSRIGYVCSAVVLVVFIITALVMKHANAGASFTDKDQVGTVVVGIILAGLFLMLTRPRLQADRDAALVERRQPVLARLLERGVVGGGHDAGDGHQTRFPAIPVGRHSRTTISNA